MAEGVVIKGYSKWGCFCSKIFNQIGL